MKSENQTGTLIVVLFFICAPAAAGLYEPATRHVGPAGEYLTIQDAINAAQDGDTIQVDPGLYEERIVINKSLTLLGATNSISKKDYVVPEGYSYNEKTESIIRPALDEDNEVVEITSGSVIFDGFIVANTVAEYYPGYSLTHLIGLSSQSADYTGVTIRNNVLGPNTNDGTQDGRKGRAGIAVYGQWQNKVHNLTISDNRIFNATGDGCGIMLLGTYNASTTAGTAGKYKGSLIDNNTITGNHRSGIEFAGGVRGDATPAGHFRITNNTITSNGWYSKSDKNNLKYGNGIVLIRTGSDANSAYNPLAWGSQYVDIDNNRITGNEKNGIYIGPINRDITITNNTISANGAGTGSFLTWDGVRVDLDEEYHNPPQKNYAYLSGIFLKNNEISANGDYGVRVIRTPAPGPVDARNNWWGDAGGPKASKNPAGTANRVSDNVAFSPWYTSPQKNQASALFPAPIALFDWSPFEIMAGEQVTFNATMSAELSNTSIQTYSWNFDDGNETAVTGPVISHTCEKSKVHKVTLTISDLNGITNRTTGYVTVIGKKAVIPLSFNGTSVGGEKGSQKITINASTSDGTVTNTTTELNIQNPGNGWAKMKVKGNTTNVDGSIVIENITEVVLTADPTVTPLNTSAGGVGAVTISLELSLKEFASAPLQVEVTEGANATVSNAFQLAAGSGSTVDVAYTMVIRGSSMINANLSSSKEPVRLNMSVSEGWVNEHGGISAIKVIRYSDNGETKEILEPRFLFSAGTPAMLFFEIISINGCSIFGVAAVSGPQTVRQEASGEFSPASQYSGAGSDSDSGGSPAVSGDKDGKKTEQRAPPETASATLTPLETPAKGEHRPHYSYPEPTGNPAYDEVVTIIVGNNEKEGGPLHNALSFIIPNILGITSVIIMSVACAFAIIWYGDRNRYWL